MCTCADLAVCVRVLTWQCIISRLYFVATDLCQHTTPPHSSHPDPQGRQTSYDHHQGRKPPPRGGHVNPRGRLPLYPDPQGYQLHCHTPPQHSYPGSHGIPQSASSSSAISHYHTYLKCVYGNSPISPNTKWPPSPCREFITLAVVEGQSCRDEYIGHTLQGNVKQVLHRRREISIGEILEPVKGQNKPRLVLMEGAPGIGKSTLAWELCRKWEELSCMQQYSLVVLLRLSEQRVQQISEVSHLFISYESKHKKSLVEEVSESQGSGVLFILDGFDELPKTVQKESFLLDLIRSDVLPASTVLVTSRPSATAQLLTSCSPKHIEILGFTQESVKAYASRIFSSQPEKLTKFLDSISASENPAINSLMYVPLNAAIIVQIYLDCKSDALLPHTLTELYTLLCLTILNRDIMTRNHSSGGVKKIGDLSGDLRDQFLELSKIAFEGITNEEVVFHNVPDDFVHFGFLDAVSALYGGGRVSYNFLHLTLQEFFAAYHISHLGSSGLEVFKQHGKDERWNVVWRFVAGLTKFEHYKGHMDSDFFIESRKDSETKISLFTIQCLFEAQSVDHFSPIFSTSPATTTRVGAWGCTALDTYALGFCISHFHTGVSWSVYMDNHSTPFACGLKRKTPSVGVIRELFFDWCPCNVGELSTALLPPHLLTSLTLCDCSLTNADLIHLSEFIPHMTCLKTLDITGNDVTCGDQDGLLKTLQQLSHSNVTTLGITCTGFCILLRYSPHDYYSSLKQLVCPSSGKLEELRVGDIDDDDDDDSRLASLVSAPSSLKSLLLWDTSLSEHVSSLKNNTCLSKLALWYGDWSRQAPHIAQILEHNKTLQHLQLKWLSKHDIDDVRTIVRALPGNNTLQSIGLHIDGAGQSDDEVSRYMRTHHEELTLDPRIHYK